MELFPPFLGLLIRENALLKIQNLSDVEGKLVPAILRTLEYLVPTVSKSAECVYGYCVVPFQLPAEPSVRVPGRGAVFFREADCTVRSLRYGLLSPLNVESINVFQACLYHGENMRQIRKLNGVHPVYLVCLHSGNPPHGILYGINMFLNAFQEPVRKIHPRACFPIKFAVSGQSVPDLRHHGVVVHVQVGASASFHAPLAGKIQALQELADSILQILRDMSLVRVCGKHLCKSLGFLLNTEPAFGHRVSLVSPFTVVSKPLPGCIQSGFLPGKITLQPFDTAAV